GSDSTVIPAPCPGLAARIEHGNLDASDLHDLLERLVGRYRGEVDSVVLGCTHYPFVKRQIAGVLGNVPFFDGARGTARRLRSLLEQADLLKPEGEDGSVTFMTSLDKPGELDLYQWFFDQPID
ncbi:MAG: glutamate racemase, partial [Parafannyhessea sp.]|uniref:glutamate racemase n=1 Tax=Parafannyhessea sp. TaxID=2847324 RepID=UPI003F0E1C34